MADVDAEDDAIERVDVVVAVVVAGACFRDEEEGTMGAVMTVPGMPWDVSWSSVGIMRGASFATPIMDALRMLSAAGLCVCG